MLAPPDPLRAAPPESLLEDARRLAADAGVTRLADITRLDRIGLPVWQAVRPMSRALSVHQGKGATHGAAQIGALLEAAESHAAEVYAGEGPTCEWADLPGGERLANLNGLARDPAAPLGPHDIIRWCMAERFDGSPCWVPFETVSLDFTLRSPSRFERASAGVATGRSRDEALRVALHELIERDARGQFRELDMIERMECEIATDSIPFSWFRELMERIEAAGSSITLHALPALCGVPVIACSLHDDGKGPTPYRALLGHAAHPVPEQVLFQAMAEAVQGRLTYIAGARDDLLPSHYDQDRSAMIFALAPPAAPGIDLINFTNIVPGPTDVGTLVSGLAKAGFDEACHLTLGDAHGFTTVRAIVPGLATLAKGRTA